jgi:2-polyprenyl-6-methoxyphenol hydroxylase-like FAD-dependent oxidoreductase
MRYDLVVVGGGLAGASLGLSMAGTGARILIIEREARFRDRVRGEGIFPWGCEEARVLGIYDRLKESCGREIPFWTEHPAPGQTAIRDFRNTTSFGLGLLTFHHEAMQEVLIGLAEEAGAQICRPAEVTNIVPGPMPEVRYRVGDREERVTARLVVGADGRSSHVRAWGAFSVERDPDCLTIASTLHEGLDAPENSIQEAMHGSLRRVILIFPLGGGCHRTYLIHPSTDPLPRFSGMRDADRFVAACGDSGLPAEWFGRAAQAGTLASFECASSWVSHPAGDGVVLIGDAAGSSDPAYGLGLSLTLRDVRLLRDHLIAQPDWRIAADLYANDHDRAFDSLRRMTSWMTEMAFATGREADATRGRAMPMIADDPTRVPDLAGVGPDAASDDYARQRYFGLV